MIKLADAVQAVTEASSDTTAGVFTFGVRGMSEPLSVISFTGRELMSGLYSFEVILACPDDDSWLLSLESTLLGQPAYLQIASGEHAPRFVHGIVAEFFIDGAIENQDRARLRVRLVPRLWLLGQRKHSRIFQEQTIKQVIDQVLKEWGVRCSWRLTQKLLPRTYCTQYQETDYEFVTRLLAEEGIYFYFSHPGGSPDLTWFGAATDSVASVAAAAGGAALAAAKDAAADVPGLAAAAAVAEAGLAAVTTVASAEVLILSDHAAGYEAMSEGTAAADGLKADLLSQGAAAVGKLGSDLLDDAAAALGEALTPSPKLIFRDPKSRVVHDNEVTAFGLRRALRPKSTRLGDYDFRRPALDLNADHGKVHADATQVLDKLKAAGEHLLDAAGVGLKPPVRLAPALDANALRVYEHHDRGEIESAKAGETEIDDDKAERLLEQLRAKAYLATGSSHCRRLEPGHTFQLVEHPLARLAGEYVLTAVQHQGRAPEWFAKLDAKDVYLSDFECVPRSVVFRPEPPPARTRQVTETARVTGPDDEEIYTDEYGRIKVRFHWDENARAGDSCSCWVRVAQAWAGAQWGQQFIPRVGMEVVVTFLGGDPDRPIVTGCVYNGALPPPFATPREATRSGLRTQSTPGKKDKRGFNELSFEDAAGSEQIYLRAERDLVAQVQNDQRTTVEGNQVTVVKGTQKQRIKQDRNEEVQGDESYRVRGNQERVVEQNCSHSVQGQLVTTVEGSSALQVNGDRSTCIQGRDRYQSAEQIDVELKSDGFIRVNGCLTTLVGRPEARRSSNLHVDGKSLMYSTDWTELESETGVVLRCGESSIRMTNKSIELAAPNVFIHGTETKVAGKNIGVKAEDALNAASNETVLVSSAASLSLSDSAKLCSSSIALSSSPESASDDPAQDAPPPTTIELVDQDGKPIAKARYVVILDDGSEMSGVTDAEGKAQLELEIPAKIVFPDMELS